VTAPVEVPAGRGSRRRWAIVAAAVVVATFAWLLYGGLDKNVVFFLTPQELIAKGSAGYDVPVRLGGQVKPGSVKWDEKTLDLRFVLVDTGGTSGVSVHGSGAPPQMFRDGMGVVVEGRFARDGVFNSTSLMVKHSNEYRAPKAGERPQEMYKTLIKGSGP
jgi:cytochrome c-type biogenesis protein CcmE